VQEPYGEGLAAHTGAESCTAVREALTGVRAGLLFSRQTDTRMQNLWRGLRVTVICTPARDLTR